MQNRLFLLVKLKTSGKECLSLSQFASLFVFKASHSFVFFDTNRNKTKQK